MAHFTPQLHKNLSYTYTEKNGEWEGFWLKAWHNKIWHSVIISLKIKSPRKDIMWLILNIKWCTSLYHIIDLSYDAISNTCYSIITSAHGLISGCFTEVSYHHRNISQHATTAFIPPHLLSEWVGGKATPIGHQILRCFWHIWKEKEKEWHLINSASAQGKEE